MLNLLNITSKLCIITMFPIISCRICRYVYDISSYLFHVSSSNGLLVITIKPKTKYTFHAATMLLLNGKR